MLVEFICRMDVVSKDIAIFYMENKVEKPRIRTPRRYVTILCKINWLHLGYRNLWTHLSYTQI